MTLEGFGATAFTRASDALAELSNELLHALPICQKESVGWVDATLEDYHPQQSVLKPDATERMPPIISNVLEITVARGQSGGERGVAKRVP
jgi:hypothetical protein